MKHLDLFSGIGGFALAARWMGWETIQFVEIDSFCQKVLNKNFPNVPIHGDIKTFNGSELLGTVDILTGGFPCQPFSVAGSRKGKSDERYLWPEMLRIIREIKPAFVIAENVSGSWELVDEICTSLEREGYATEPIGIEAASVGANHRRLRYWFIAYTDSIGLPRREIKSRMARPKQQLQGLLPSDFWTEVSRPRINRVDHGLPNRVDRIKSIGNAIVPQVAFEIFKAIESLKINSLK
jgi:DNA (cytosine-5)-methyltransferase 1